MLRVGRCSLERISSPLERISSPRRRMYSLLLLSQWENSFRKLKFVRHLSSVVRPSSGLRPYVSQLSLNLMHGFFFQFWLLFPPGFPWAIRLNFFLIFQKKKKKKIKNSKKVRTYVSEKATTKFERNPCIRFRDNCDTARHGLTDARTTNDGRTTDKFRFDEICWYSQAELKFAMVLKTIDEEQSWRIFEPPCRR